MTTTVSPPPLLSPRELDELAHLAAPFFTAQDVSDMVHAWSIHVDEFGPAQALPVFQRAFASLEERIAAESACMPEAREQLRRFHSAVLARIAQRLQ